MSGLNRTLKGEYEDKRLESLHRVLLMMLDDFTEICKNEGLRWFGAYGTNIGAVRHGGFIPWDDDVDLCMPRADYNKLLKVVPEKYGDKYEVIDQTINENYPISTARLMLRGTTFADAALAELNFDSGIFLDIFPLDNRPDNDFLMVRHALHAWFWNKIAIAKAQPHPHVLGKGLVPSILRGGTVVANKVLNLPLIRKFNPNDLALKWSTRYNGIKTTRAGYICDTNPFWDVLNWDDLFPVQEVPFEDIVMPLPKEYDAWLRVIYGDYMTPPPVEQRYERYPDILDFGPYAAELEEAAK